MVLHIMHMTKIRKTCVAVVKEKLRSGILRRWSGWCICFSLEEELALHAYIFIFKQLDEIGLGLELEDTGFVG